MDEKRWEMYLDEVLSFVKFKYDHKAIRRELAEHMADLKEDLMAEGMDEDAAEYMTVEYMGEAAEIGQELDQEHHALLGWVWRISRILVACLIGANIMPLFSFVTGMTSNIMEKYEPSTEATVVWQMELDKEYQIYDDTLILDDIYYYEDKKLDVVYHTKRSPLSRSIGWGMTISLGIFDAEGNDIREGGGGYKSGGYYGIGVDHLDEVPADAKTLEIYCSDLAVTVDLETGEVTDNAET
ncbi:permease prefix domain 1-containing protein [Anaerotignum sp.]